jgi:hypothetical protein
LINLAADYHLLKRAVVLFKKHGGILEIDLLLNILLGLGQESHHNKETNQKKPWIRIFHH